MSNEEFMEEMRVGRLRMDEVLRKAFGPGLAPDPYDHQAYMKVVTRALREEAHAERPADPPAWFQEPRYPSPAAMEQEAMSALHRTLKGREDPMLEFFRRLREEDAARRASESPEDHAEPDY